MTPTDQSQQNDRSDAPASAGLAARRDRVVRFHYELRSADGALLESTFDSEPAVALIGRSQLIPGVETALAGLTGGAELETELAPAAGFGERDDQAFQRISKKYFPKGQRLVPGMVTALSTEQGRRPVTIVKVGRTVVDVDLNHPRAGETLALRVRVVEVRKATPEELAHGHVHGPGGHAH